MYARRLRYLLPSGLFAATLALASVYADFDHHVNFSCYHTYSWAGIQAGNSIWQNRIAGAVDAELAARGWRRVSHGGDATISATGTVTERDVIWTDFTGFPGWGWGWGWGAGWDATAITHVIPEDVGNLTINLFDGATHKLIWQATAEKTLSSKPSKNDKKLQHAVADMFEHFPPRPKG
jgi:Domain of unknown function (DUF4136)